MTTEFDYDAIRTGIVAALDEPVMVTNYALVACVVEANGEEAVRTITDCDHSWQVLGLLHHALLVTKAGKYDDEGDDG